MNNNWENWKKWEEELDKEHEIAKLKDTKSGSIAYIKDIVRLKNWEDFNSHWEDY